VREVSGPGVNFMNGTGVGQNHGGEGNGASAQSYCGCAMLNCHRFSLPTDHNLPHGPLSSGVGSGGNMVVPHACRLKRGFGRSFAALDRARGSPC